MGGVVSALALFRHVLLGASLIGLISGAWGQNAADRTTSGNALSRAESRQKDAETLSSLLAEGRLLYERDKLRLGGYQYCSQAVSLAEQGEFRGSIEAASKALYLGQESRDDNLIASAKRDFAIAYSYAGDLERADDYARQALRHKYKSASAVAAPSYKILGDVAMRRKRWAQAIAHYESAAAVASAKLAPLISLSLINAYVEAGVPEDARRLFDQFPPPEGGVLISSYRRTQGNLLLAENQTDKACEVFAQAAQPSQQADADYARMWALEGLGRCHLQRHDSAQARQALAQAIEAVEKVRAKFRSEEFKAGLFGDIQGIFEQAIGLAVDEKRFDDALLLAEQSRGRALLDIVRNRVGISMSSTTISSVDELRHALRPNEAIVEYFMLPDRLVTWVIRDTGIHGSVRKVSPATLRSDVDMFRTAVLRRRSQDVNGQAAILYDDLLTSAKLVTGEKVIIVPHGPLHYLPFQALRTGNQFMIERHPMAIAPSATMTLDLLSRKSRLESSLVAFGNPSTSAREPLPGAEQEVRKISSLFPKKQVFYTQQADRQAFINHAGAARMLHVAAHAEVDFVDPLASRILLASKEPDSGFLTAREIYDVDLHNTSLVTVSACESGLGRIARGDEIMGLSRSFFSAGADGLVMSLWPVADDSTELLMTTFYGELSRGSELIDALQKAQLSVMRHKGFAQPFFWAPFSASGNWRLKLNV